MLSKTGAVIRKGTAAVDVWARETKVQPRTRKRAPDKDPTEGRCHLPSSLVLRGHIHALRACGSPLSTYQALPHKTPTFVIRLGLLPEHHLSGTTTRLAPLSDVDKAKHIFALGTKALALDLKHLMIGPTPSSSLVLLIDQLASSQMEQEERVSSSSSISTSPGVSSLDC